MIGLSGAPRAFCTGEAAHGTLEGQHAVVGQPASAALRAAISSLQRSGDPERHTSLAKQKCFQRGMRLPAAAGLVLLSSCHTIVKYNPGAQVENGKNVRAFRMFITRNPSCNRDTMQASSQTMRTNSFLKNLTPEQWNLLAPFFESVRASAGTAIFEQGDRATHLYVLLRGRVTISFKPHDGSQIVVARLRGGDVFGWSSVIGGRTYTSSAVCVTRVDALRIRGADLQRVCREHPQAGGRILERLAEVVSPRWKNAREQIQRILDPNHMSSRP